MKTSQKKNYHMLHQIQNNFISIYKHRFASAMVNHVRIQRGGGEGGG